MAVVSSVPLLKTVVFRVTSWPSCLVKNPFASPTSAGSWVMLARKPSRSTTGPEPPPDDAGDEPHPAASTATAATPAARRPLRIMKHPPIFPVRLVGDLSDLFSR